jgi:hypothetical protein
MPAIRAVRAELDRRGISVPLSGPDWCDLGQNTPDFDLGDKALGALDAHNYKATVSADLMKLWAERAHARGIPFFQSEFGTWNGDDPFKNPTAISPRSYSNQMLNAEKLIAGLNAGVDGFNRWSFVNRGDLDGQWQLVRTWDAQRWDYYRRVEPEPVPYFSYGILTRFLAKYSRILSTEVSGDSIVASAIQSPAGDLTIYVLNNADMEKMINLNIAGRTEFPELNKYQVTQSGIEGADYKMDPLRLFGLKDSPPNLAADTVPPGSITVYSTLNKECL